MAVHKVSGVVVQADQAVLDRLGPGWEIQQDKPKPKARKSSKKSAS